MIDEKHTRGLSRTSSRALLGRILDQPDLPAQIERLPPEVLGRLVDRVGLEDAGEILSLASTEQIARIFDEDLWKNERPGEDETFDAARFLVWLEVLSEAGEDFVAKKLVELPEDLVTLALHRHVLVIDIDALANEMSDGDGDGDERWQLEKALESTLYEEIGEYRLIARRHDGWDALWAAVLALDKEHHDHLFRILARCCAMSTEHIEENGGLYEVLTSEETLETDVAADREDRRAAEGHVAPSAAKSFLALCRTPEGASATERDPMTKAYFRELAPPKIVAPAKPSKSAKHPARPTLERILAEAGLGDEPQVGRLLGAGPSRDEPLLVRAMRLVAEADLTLFGRRSEELAYLANVLVTGAPHRGRRFRPIEALRAVLATCSLGLHLVTQRALVSDETVRAAAEALGTVTADGLFRLAHHRLYSDVTSRARALLTATGRRTDEALTALAEDIPCLAGALLHHPSKPPGAAEDPVRFPENPTELAAAIHFLEALENGGEAPLKEEEDPAPKKPVAKKASAKKPVAKKAPAKKPVAKKAPAKKPVAKKASAKKPVAKKPATKKPVRKR